MKTNVKLLRVYSSVLTYEVDKDLSVMVTETQARTKLYESYERVWLLHTINQTSSSTGD